MRKVATKDPKIREEQLRNLLINIKRLDEEELKDFVINILSDSEKAFLSQRLDIIQMLLQGYSYADLKKILYVSNTGITNAQSSLDRLSSKLRHKLLKNCLNRKVPDNKLYSYDSVSEARNFASSGIISARKRMFRNNKE